MTVPSPFSPSRAPLAVLVLALALAFAGCNPAAGEENPITPDKMNEMRAKENASRAQGNPGATGPRNAGSPGAGSR